MKVPIYHSKLLDSPYDGKDMKLFDFTESDTKDLVQDIIQGNPTCYLISGYRGAGKSSFIKKLENEINSQEKNVLFVYLNFAKYEDRSIVLRKLIRNFYLSAEKHDIFKNRKKENLEILTQFKELYERTFYEVSKNTNEKKEDRFTSTFSFRTNFKDLVLIAITLVVSIAIILGFKPQNWYSWLLVIFPILGASFYESNRFHENSKSSEIKKSMLYDDEIAEHYFIKILNDFRNELKPVFVLDELDKIKDDELAESLINELKPVMLSGLSSFIVVVGQNLYYNYYSSQLTDDGILSSLFSKVHHVSLFSASELRLVFNKIIKINPEELSFDNKQFLDAYVDYLIFQSKRIPRRFIVLIRQNMVWEDNEAFLEFDQTLDELLVYSKILDRVESIEYNSIDVEGYAPPIKDYFSMNLLLKAHNILNTKNHYFTDKQLFNADEE